MPQLIILLLSISCNYSFSQKLTFNELLLLHNKSLDYVNDYLLNHGWEIYSSKQISQQDPFETVVWAHTINRYDRNLASGWISINFIEPNMTRVAYTTYSSDIFNSIKNEMPVYTYNIYNIIRNGFILNSYYGNSIKNFFNVFIVLTPEYNKKINEYTFILVSKNDKYNDEILSMYRDYILLNTVKKLSPEQMESLQEDSGESGYSDDESDGVKTLLKYIGEDTDSQTSRNLLQNISSNTETKKIDYDNKSDFIDTPFDIPLRESPDVNSKEIYSCPKNSKIQLLYGGNEAYQLISIDGHKGYVSRKFIKK